MNHIVPQSLTRLTCEIVVPAKSQLMTNQISSTDVGRIVDDLHSAAGASPRCSADKRVALCRECLDGVVNHAREWTESAAKAKGLRVDSPVRAEDVLSGPVVVARQLQLTMQTLTALNQRGTPVLPGTPFRLPSNQLCVPVFPAKGYFDSLTFMGLHGAVRMQDGVDANAIHGDLPQQILDGDINGVSAVLGAGNVSSIPITDSLNRIMFEGRRVVLKMNPVNEYLTPVFEKAFAPLIREQLFTVVTGDVKTGQELLQNPRIDDVHITGSAATHDAIVWGGNDDVAAERRRTNSPLLNKPVTSELGNVTPWIVVPGNYSTRQLHSQAQHIATSITNNASFNCLATKVILTWDQWPQRDQFLQLLQQYLKATPQRPAYYPGAAERFRRFANTEIQPDDRNCLPWTLLTNQRINERPELFHEESFVCVCAETSLAAKTPSEFLLAATDFVNDQMTGTLCASVTIPPGFRRQQADVLEQSLSRLRYGSVCVNQWSGLAYGLISPPWGAYPGASLTDIQSGIGNVHNTFLLDRVEKTVLHGPLINFPKPIWFPSHRKGVVVAEQLLKLYHRPSALRLPRLFAAALMG